MPKSFNSGEVLKAIVKQRYIFSEIKKKYHTFNYFLNKPMEENERTHQTL